MHAATCDGPLQRDVLRQSVDCAPFMLREEVAEARLLLEHDEVASDVGTVRHCNLRWCAAPGGAMGGNSLPALQLDVGNLEDV